MRGVQLPVSFRRSRTGGKSVFLVGREKKSLMASVSVGRN